MTIKHTPGPWSVEGDEFGLLIRMEQLAGKDEYLAIYASPNPEQRLADAHLMALALTAPHECDDPECPGNKNRLKLEAYPDLLQAIKALICYFEPLEVGASVFSNLPELRERVLKAKTVIAKAEEIK